MRYFAKIENGKAANVIVADPEFFDTFVDDAPGKWVEVTSTNASGLFVPSVGISFSFDRINNTFIAPEIEEVEE